MSTPLELQVKSLPSKPGVYLNFDKEEVIIYIGKAKNLFYTIYIQVAKLIS